MDEHAKYKMLAEGKQCIHKNIILTGLDQSKN